MNIQTKNHMETVAMRRIINYLCLVGKVKALSIKERDSYKTDLNAKKCACNDARSSEYEHVGMRDSMRKGDLNIQTKNQMETVAIRRRINYLCVVGKVTLKI